MKKQVAVVLSFSALLTLSAFAPKIFWQDQKHVNRFPASKEDPKPETKLEEIKAEIKIKSEEATVQCLKDEQPTALEEEIKKLMADKEAIIKQIDDLKAKKEKSPASDKKEKKVAQASDKEDVVALISQMTSMMISQQEQQQMLMQQMFTMMNQMQMQMSMQSYPQQQQAYWPQNFMAPITFQSSQMDMSSYNQRSSIFGNLGQGIGISYPTQSMASYQNPYEIQARTPSAQMDSHSIQRDINVQPQFQSEYPAGNMGFNFLSSDPSSEMQRMML